MLVLAQVSSMKTRREGVDALLVIAPARPVAAYVRAILLARDERLFLSVTPSRRKKRLISEVSAARSRVNSNQIANNSRVRRPSRQFPAGKPSRRRSAGALVLARKPGPPR